MKQIFNSIFSNSSEPAVLPQAEKESLLELLLLAIYTDHEVSVQEERIINKLERELAWDKTSEIPFDSFIAMTTAKVRGAHSNPIQTEQALKKLAHSFSSRDSKQLALSLLAAVLKSDSLEQEEKILFTTFKKHLVSTLQS